MIPTTAQLRRWTGEPNLDLDRDWLRRFFSGHRDEDAINQWRGRVEGERIYTASRRGLVGFWEVCRLRRKLLTGPGSCHPAHYAAVTADAWNEGKRDHACREFGICEPAEMLDALRPFALSPVIMNDDELSAFAALPETLTVYRGGLGPADHLAAGHSWTTDRATAEWFRDNRPGGLVIERQAKKAEALAYFQRERELVLYVMAGLLRKGPE